MKYSITLLLIVCVWLSCGSGGERPKKDFGVEDEDLAGEMFDDLDTLLEEDKGTSVSEEFMEIAEVIEEEKKEDQQFQDVKMEVLDEVENEYEEWIEEFDQGIEINVEAEIGQMECPGAPGCKCQKDDECNSGKCVETLQGFVCGQKCVTDEDCEKGYMCELGRENIGLCKEPKVLCQPCLNDEDCNQELGGNNKCIDYGGWGMFCGTPCGDNTPCPTLFSCENIEGKLLCKRVSWAPCPCTKEFKEKGYLTKCYSENQLGKCEGVKTCDGTCNAPEPSVEVCDGKDNDCNGETDDNAVDCKMFYKDEDKDGYGGKTKKCLCYPESPFIVENWDDCDDMDPMVNPEGKEKCNDKDDDCNGVIDDEDAEGCDDWYLDEDQDGIGVDKKLCLCKPKVPYTAKMSGDCDDKDSSVKPGTSEICNGKDDDCDGEIDEGGSGCKIWYKDEDADGFGVKGDSRCLCSPLKPYTAEVVGDCDDSDEGVNPMAEEVCDGKDNNCDGKTDPENSKGCVAFYFDKDNDGYGLEFDWRCLCKDEGMYSATMFGDCDESNPKINPGAKEDCSTQVDDNCDGKSDEEDANGCKVFYKDEDNDGFGTEESQCWCEAHGVFSAQKKGDCNDLNPDVFPGAKEICDGEDNDCDGKIDPENTNGCMWFYFDADHDDFGTNTKKCLCSPTGVYTAFQPGDCDDSNPLTYPFAPERCDGLDNDCDGKIEPNEGAVDCKLFYKDKDGDGFGTAEYKCLCKPDGNYLAVKSGDCNDSDSNVYPDAEEICNDKDDNCDGLIDPPSSKNCKVWWADKDGDTFGDENESLCLCNGPMAQFTATKGGDCNDLDPDINPLAKERCDTPVDDNCNGETNEKDGVGCNDFYKDADKDGFGVDNKQCWCKPHGVFTAYVTGDCNDGDPDVNPLAEEVCSNKDDNCDGIIDPEGSPGCENYFEDIDNDGFGKNNTARCLCGPEGVYRAKKPDDCDDTDLQVNPGKKEKCDGKDNDCDGLVDEEGAEGCEWYYADLDQDGFGSEAEKGCVCGDPPFPLTIKVGGDCDDGNPLINPKAKEDCNTVADDNCNGSNNELDALGCIVYKMDKDGDGWGTDKGECWCAPYESYSALKTGDCNDEDKDVHPNANEVCNNKDDDCDSITDPEGSEGCEFYYQDGDKDGWGVKGAFRCLCKPYGDFVATKSGDCDDTDPNVNPGAKETCGGKDLNCNGIVNEEGSIGCVTYYIDKDMDTFGLETDAKCLCYPTGLYKATKGGDCNDETALVYPGRPEECDGFDNDCDGIVDPPNTEGCMLFYKDEDGDMFGEEGFSLCLCEPKPPFTSALLGDCDDKDPDINPNVEEICNGKDDDCDGVVDEGC